VFTSELVGLTADALLTCVYISEPPQWLVTSLSPARDVFVNDTEPLRVHCTGRGNPAPWIHWTKDGRSLDTGWYTVHPVLQRANHSTTVTSTLSWQGSMTVSLNYCYRV